MKGMDPVKTIIQLFRQPMKTLFGVILVAMAVAVLCVCVGQSLAAKETQARLDEIFSTGALPSVNYTKEADEWARNYAEEHPEIVKEVGAPGLVSAYIPELCPDNYTAHPDEGNYRNDNYIWLPNKGAAQYTSVLLEVTLTEVGEPSSSPLYVKNSTEEYTEASDTWTCVSFTGTVENVIGLAEGYPDYTGFKVSGTLFMPSLEKLEKLELTVGGRYLVYSTALRDLDWSLRCEITSSLPQLGGVLIAPFDLDNLTVSETVSDPSVFGAYVIGYYQIGDFRYELTNVSVDYIRHISVYMENQSAMPNLTWEMDSDRNPVAVIQDYRSYPGENGETVTVTPEEYHERYAEPTIVRLDTTAEEFLAGEEGALWREALYNIEINSHSFPMIGVDDLSLIADFAQSKAAIVEGRDFTAGELSGGEKVCILSRALAELNGLSVGDTLSVQPFENDPGVPYQINISEGNGSARPVAYFFFDRTMDLEAVEEYTIIGLYDQEIRWENIEDNLYAFSPNTIFVPKASVSARMDYGYGAFFRTFRLQNGAIGEFRQAAAAAGYAGMFYFNDNGYSAVEGSMDTYREAAGRALIVGVCVYAVVMLLFFLFFPARERAALRVMETLGSKRSVQLNHMMCHCGAILVPGTVIGTAAGILLWETVVDSLLPGSHAALEINVSTSAMAAVAGIQLIMAMFLSLLAALVMTNGKNLMKRK